MGSGGCYSCMKWLLIIFNIVVLLVGAAILGLGLWLYLEDQNGVKDMSAVWGHNTYSTGVYVMMAAGSLAIVISLFGCCGAFMECRWLLALYFTLMLILCAIFLAGGILGFVFKDEIEDQMRDDAEDTLVDKYGIDEETTDGWDKLFQDLKCCGVSGDVYSNTSWAIFKVKSKWFTSDSRRTGQFVPFKCCKPGIDRVQCAGMNNSRDYIPRLGPPVTTDDLATSNDDLFTNGCIDKMIDDLEDNAIVIGVACLVAVLFMLLAAIFAICLCVRIGREGYVV